MAFLFHSSYDTPGLAPHINEFVLTKYRPSSTSVAFDLLLHQLLSFPKFSFLDFSLASFEILTWNLVFPFVLTLRDLVIIDQLYVALASVINKKYNFVHCKWYKLSLTDENHTSSCFIHSMACDRSSSLSHTDPPPVSTTLFFLSDLSPLPVGSYLLGSLTIPGRLACRRGITFLSMSLSVGHT